MRNILNLIQTPLFIIVGTLIVYLGYKIKSSDPTISQQSRNIVEREQNANFVPNIDIPNHFFIKPDITLPFDKINLTTNNKKALMRISEELKVLLSLQMIKPMQETNNIELKEKYGVQSFENILNYEQNYNNYIINLNSIAQILIKDAQISLAEIFLLEAVKIKSENSRTYINLINIYRDESEQKLLDFIENFKENNVDENKYYVKKVLEHFNSINK